MTFRPHTLSEQFVTGWALMSCQQTLLVALLVARAARLWTVCMMS